MKTRLSEPASLEDLDAQWRDRQSQWRRKLGRLHLGVEPLEEQLARYRRVTWGLTAVPVFIATIIVSLFAAFGRPEIGLGFVAIVFLPIVAIAWWDDAKRAEKVRSYRAEESRYLREREALSLAPSGENS